MNTIYRLTTLLALTLSTLGADVKFSALPTATSPSTNSYLPIIDLNLLPAAQNQKYLLTNLAAATPAGITNALGISTTPTELQYVSGVTSAIQTQLNGKYGISQIGTLTHAGTVTLTNSANYSEADIVLTGAVTFATSALAAGSKYTLYGRNTQATNCTPTFPSWRWMGGAPSTITALKEFTISLSSRGTVDTNVWAAYTEAQ